MRKGKVVSFQPSFPLIIKLYMATSVYPFPTVPQKGERGISSALCHLPSHGLLIGLPDLKPIELNEKHQREQGTRMSYFRKSGLLKYLKYFFLPVICTLKINKGVLRNHEKEEGSYNQQKLIMTT